MDLEEGIRRLYPYAEEFGVTRGFPEHGMPRDALLAQLRSMAEREDRNWESGRCSGAMYSGDRDHHAWIDAHGNGDFVVALRSALISAGACRLFAGCGIVAESEPAREYRETNLKLSGMRAAIEARDAAANLRTVAPMPAAAH